MAQLGAGGIEQTEVEQVNDAIGTEVDMAEADKASMRRVAAAVNLHLAGATYLEVAKTLDYASPQAARLAIERGLADQEPEGADKAAARNRMSLQYDMLLRSVIPNALKSSRDDQLAYVNTASKILAQKAQLLGLNAPTVLHVNPSNDEMESVVLQVLEIAGAVPSPEGDPFADIEDAEVIEDDGR